MGNWVSLLRLVFSFCVFLWVFAFFLNIKLIFFLEGSLINYILKTCMLESVQEIYFLMVSYELVE